jgi:hypothetical protein
MGLTSGTNLCIPTTGELFEYFGKNTPLGRENDGTAFLQFLKSNTNTQGLRRLSDSITGVAGKTRGVKLATKSPVCFSICASPFNCLEEPTPYSVPLSFFDYEIESRFTPCDGSGDPMALVMDSAQYAQYCALDDKSFFDEMIMNFDMRFVKELNKSLVQMLLTNITNTVKSYPILANNTATGQRVLNDELPLWIEELVATAKMTTSDYVIFGGQMVNLVKAKFGIGTLSTEGATSVVSTLPDMYFDRTFDTVFGKNSLVLIPKAAFQFVEWTQYTGSKAFNGEREILFNKSVPLGNGTSQTIDFTWEWDPKCSKYQYMPSLYAELIKAIGGGCGLGNTQDGIFIIKDCNTTLIPTCS